MSLDSIYLLRPNHEPWHEMEVGETEGYACIFVHGSTIPICVYACDNKSMMTYGTALYVRWTSDWGSYRASQGKGRAESPYYSHASWNPHVCYCRTSVYRNTPNRGVLGHHFALIWTLCTMFTLCKWSWYVIQYACHYYWIQTVCLITTCVRSWGAWLAERH